MRILAFPSFFIFPSLHLLILLFLSSIIHAALSVSQQTDSNSPAYPSPFPFNPGFNIQNVASLALSLPSHSWEFGTASEALLELYNPELAVFAEDPFRQVHSQSRFQSIPSLTFASSKITLNLSSNAGANVLSDGDGATGDPASLGVSAILLGQGLGLGLSLGNSSTLGNNETRILEFREGARRMMEYLVNGAPRFENGAISQRADVAELWADFVYMAPPFLAYYGVSTSNLSLLLDTVEQCGLYRQILQLGSPSDIENNPNPPSQVDALDGLWRHIVGPQLPDPGLWSTGNAWAAAGMTRVLATVMKAPKKLFQSPISSHSLNLSESSSLNSASPQSTDLRSASINALTTYIKEILDGVVFTAPLDNGILRNYLNETLESGHGYGEISGSSLLASVIYRMIILRPEVFLSAHSDQKDSTGLMSVYLTWAEGIRHTIGSDGHVSSNGTVAPAVDPLDWGSTVPYTTGSPEGQNFVILMYAAWRDCVLEGVCQED